MNDLISIFKKDLHRLISDLKKINIINNINFESINIDYSSKSKRGDLSTNILLILRKKNIDENFDINKYVSNFLNNLIYIESIEIAKAGFVNAFIKKKYLISKLKNLFIDSSNKNKKDEQRLKINIEFVSANPTGPIHVAHMRGAVLGDVLASILQSTGHDVLREYYVNDAGSQIIILGKSLFKRYQQLLGQKVKLTEEDYPGEYLKEIAKNIVNTDQKKWLLYENTEVREKYFQKYAVNFLIKNIKHDLSLINIYFDKFTFESQIVEGKFIKKVFSLLKENHLLYEGVLKKPLGDENNNWKPRKQLLFRSSNFSDDVDRPFKKVDGQWTYFANDAAYHYEKYTRGFDKLINIWGADHIGYISRMKSITDVVTKNNNYLEIFICQIVRLIKDGKLLKMSKREGNFVTLKEIFNEVGKDALRYFMISSKSETPMDFDMNKVIEKNKDNPVFYCQYAYARASSVIRKASQFKKIPKIQDSFDLFDLSTVSKYEWEIILKMLSWPYVLIQAAEYRQPHRITNFLEEIASQFHSFWNKGKENASLRMIDENNVNKTLTKLIWIESFRMTLFQAFQIIGINAPDVM